MNNRIASARSYDSNSDVHRNAPAVSVQRTDRRHQSSPLTFRARHCMHVVLDFRELGAISSISLGGRRDINRHSLRKHCWHRARFKLIKTIPSLVLHLDGADD